MVHLKGLTAGKTYRFRVISKEILQFEPYEVIYGNTVVSEIYDFTTLDPDKKQISFQVLQDIHDDTERLDSILRTISWNEVDMVFFNGDTLSHLTDENDIFSGFLDVSVKHFACKIPFIFIRGNHETRGPFARNLIDYFPPRESRYYYTFKHGPVFFIILDSGEDKPDDSPVYAGLADFDEYRQTQAKWLQEVILRDDVKNAAFRIAVFHIPPFSSNYSSHEITRLWVPLFNEGKLDLAICGHLHKRIRQDPVPGKNDFTYIIGSREDCFRIDVEPDYIKITIMNMNGEKIDSFMLPSKKEGVPGTYREGPRNFYK
jgi:predicted phosphodiesterase